MRVDIVTLFPEMFDGPFNCSILKKAQERGILEVSFVNPRDFAVDSHRTVDDRPYGGGKGMLMKAEPLFRAVRSVKKRGSFVVYFSPRGKRLNQALAKRLSRKRHMILVCGHYEGVDERFLKEVDLSVSMGDYILTGGEIPAMATLDAVGRLLPGVLDKTATAEESFADGFLEFPQYTRPRIWKGMEVPSLLLSGNHERIAQWKMNKRIKIVRDRKETIYDERNDSSAV
ncbi:MAG: tRNA (guanosine(37)-N1)-methyltransferase TrmD [Elusimicrobia bacterium]|nr:tRNA (guanosine(37)-N1)-methyltransferase TrmD [Elusimicrobiota bacterium]